MGKRRNRRRSLVVNKPLQARLIFSMSVVPVLGLSALLVLVAYFCHELRLEVLAADVEVESVAPFLLAVTGCVLVAGVLLLYNALRISHRIAGPMHRICESLERVRNGDLAFRVQLRPGDHLREVCDELNRLIDALNENPPPGATTRLMRAYEDPAERAAAAAETALAGGRMQP
jgi:hypothetical protein